MLAYVEKNMANFTFKRKIAYYFLNKLKRLKSVPNILFECYVYF